VNSFLFSESLRNLFPNDTSLLTLYVHNLTFHFALSYEKAPLAWQSSERFEAAFNLLNQTTSNNITKDILVRWINQKWERYSTEFVNLFKRGKTPRKYLYSLNGDHLED